MKGDKYYRKITFERLEECLTKIGWNLQHHGCDCYYFYNSFNKVTQIKYLKDINRIEADSRQVFGIGGADYIHHGLLYIDLKDCVIHLGGNIGKSRKAKHDFLAILPKGHKSIFLQLYAQK